MKLIPNQPLPEPVTVSTEAHENPPVVNRFDSPLVPKEAGTSRNIHWLFLGVLIGAMLISFGGILFRQYRDKYAERLALPTFIKARTHSLGAAGPSSPPKAITVQLSADMVRVSAIALGHPRLAVINGKTVIEGDNVALQSPGSSVALILRVAKIGDGSIELTDGKQSFRAQLTIPSRPKSKQL